MLLSIRPRFADLILEGEKTFELRRRRPKLVAGDTVVIYVSSPVRAIQGAFKVAEVVETDPDKLWERVEAVAGLDREEYQAYFQGALTAVGIGVGQVRKFSDPVGLDDLREMWEGFTAPQSYRYLCAHEVDELLSRQAPVATS